MKGELTTMQIKEIAETVIEKLMDDLYDEDVDLESRAISLAEYELDKLDVEWTSDEADLILDEIEIQELIEHRKEVFYTNRVGVYASLGLSQADFV